MVDGDAAHALRIDPALYWEESEMIAPPATAEEFAEQAIYVIYNSGMANHIAVAIHARCMDALRQTATKTLRAPSTRPGFAAALSPLLCRAS